jgi:hypothetical protein
MARTDIAGLLTGMPSSRPDPMGMGINSEQQRLSFGAQRAEGLQRGVRGLMGGDTRTPAEQLQMAMAQLDLSKPEDLRKLAGIQQATGDLTGAAKTAAALQQLSQEKNTRDSLIRLAKSQGNTEIEEFLKAGGDPAKAAEVLFRKKSPVEPKSYVMTQSKKDEYLDRWGQLTDEQKIASGAAVPGKFYGINEDSTKLNQLFARAEQIFATNPTRGGRPAALEQAIMETSGAAPVIPTIGGPSPVEIPVGDLAPLPSGSDPFKDTPRLVIGE